MIPILLSNCQFFDKHVVVEENVSYLEEDNKLPVENVKGKELFKRDCSMCHQKGKRGIDLIRNLGGQDDKNILRFVYHKT